MNNGERDVSERRAARRTPGCAQLCDAQPAPRRPSDVVREASGDVVREASGDVVREASGDMVREASSDIVRGASGDMVREASGDMAREASGDSRGGIRRTVRRSASARCCR